MLVYRLIHFKDEIPDIDMGVEGREKELSKPIIQLFYNKQAQNELEETLQYFLNLRTERKEITLEPTLHRVVTNLVNRHSNELYVKTIWDKLRTSIPDGYYDEKKPNEYQTLEYGTIYNNSVSNILEHIFGGRSRHKEAGNLFIFDPEELERVGRAYNLTTNIQTKLLNIIEEHRTRPGGSEGYRESHAGINHDRIAENIANSAISQGNQVQKFDEKEIDEGGDRHHIEPSEGSDPSGQFIEESSVLSSTLELQKVPATIYRLGHSDTWACKDCNIKGDKWFMLTHPEYCKARNNQTKPG